jgi:hypothetical protein
LLVRWVSGWNKEDPRELQTFIHVMGDREMAVVNGIEAATEKAETVTIQA